MTTIDFMKALADARGASYEALPIGDYDVEIDAATATRTSNDKPMIKVTMKVLTGPYERRSVFNNFVLSLENAQAVAIFFRHMKCFGLNDEFFAALGAQASLEPVAHALVGRRARITLGHRDWQGETRNEVKGVKPYTGAPALADPSRVAGFATFSPNGPTAPGVPTGPAPLPQTPPPAPPVPAATVQPPATPTTPATPLSVVPAPPIQPTYATPGYQPLPSEPETPRAVPTDGGPSTAPSSNVPPNPATSEPYPPHPPASPTAPELPI